MLAHITDIFSATLIWTNSKFEDSVAPEDVFIGPIFNMFKHSFILLDFYLHLFSLSIYCTFPQKFYPTWTVFVTVIFFHFINLNISLFINSSSCSYVGFKLSLIISDITALRHSYEKVISILTSGVTLHSDKHEYVLLSYIIIIRIKKRIKIWRWADEFLVILFTLFSSKTHPKIKLNFIQLFWMW